MVLVKCKNCSKQYDYYKHGCCPACGAYNRPPRRDRVGSDGVVHHISDADFLDNTRKRRSSQSGKVCFEDQAGKARGSRDSLFSAGQKKKTDSKKSDWTKMIKIAVAVVAIVNILPISLTMCSVSGVFEEIVDELFSSEVAWDEPVEVPVSPAVPDLTGTELIDFGQSFLWGDKMACVTGVGVYEEKRQTKIELTIKISDPSDKPRVFYSQSNDAMAAAVCTEALRVADGEYTYCYDLPDRQPGSVCYALFTGQTDGEWYTYALALN